MNNEITLELLKTCEVIELEGKGLKEELFKNAAEKTDLALADYLTIRDLKTLSGCGDDALDALLISMFRALEEGSLCLKLTSEGLKKRLDLFLAKGSEKLADQIMENVEKGRYSDLIGCSTDEYKPLIIRTQKDCAYIYFQKYLKHEISLKTSLDALLAASERRLDISTVELKKYIRDVLEKKPMHTKSGKTITLNDDQKTALILSLIKDFVIVSGGPGTGKTSIVITILRLLMRCGVAPDRIRLAAPTGRAAQRMTDAIHSGLASIAGCDKADERMKDLAGSTIHRLLKYSPSANRFTYNARNRLPADIVIIDEVSMVDVVLMAKLLEALAPGTKVIFLGDKDQLPSVEAGAVLTDLMPRQSEAAFTKKMVAQINAIVPDVKIVPAKAPDALTDRVVILKSNYRSDKSILNIAQRVNEQDAAVADEIALLDFHKDGGRGGGVRFIVSDSQDIGAFHRLLASWARHHYFTGHHVRSDITAPYAELVEKAAGIDFNDIANPKNIKMLKDIFAYLEQARVLGLVRHGPFGTISVNRAISKLMRTALDPRRFGPVFAGAPIMVIQNDYVKDLYNGEVGVVLKGSDGSYHGVFERSGTYISYPADVLPPHESAFAITVHKSQGSEYDNVLLVLPSDEESRQLTKEIIYTGLTRARHLAAIYGAKKVLKKAISERIERESGIRFYE